MKFRNSFDFVIDSISTPAGKVQRVSPELTRKDLFEHLLARISNEFRMSFSVNPGLYAVGRPTETSYIFVTANYKMSFDLLKNALKGTDSWVLVLDTKGINVWCAAGKGTFGTYELIEKLEKFEIKKLVNNHTLILPQLGASGIDGAEVKKRTGFSVIWGPVYLRDLGAFLSNGLKKTEKMSEVSFDFWDRLILTPMELIPALKTFLKFSLFIFLFSGLTKEGIIFDKFLGQGFPLVYYGFMAVLGGTLVTPALLPFLPSSYFVLKGFLVGFVIQFFSFFISGIPEKSLWLCLFSLFFFPSVSAYLALNFTGATPVTSVSGVKRELRLFLPFFFGILIFSALILLAYKLKDFS